MLNRRSLLGLVPLPFLFPRLAHAAGASAERKFLFVFCVGGWDQTTCFAPVYGASGVDMERDSAASTIGGITFVDQKDRPSVRGFFSNYHDRVAIINGFEVASITHDRCTRLLLTGRGDTGTDDWGAILAGHATSDLLLPHLVMSGPSYSAAYTSSVVRLGTTGQLSKLLDGSCISRESATAVEMPSAAAQTAVDAFVRNRVAAYEAAARSNREASFGAGYGASLDKVERLADYGANLMTENSGDMRYSQFKTAVNCLSTGLSRCAMVEYDGLWSSTFDTHSQNFMQSYHFEELFQFLGRLMADLDGAPGPAGGRLSDETTVVVFSEMGRGPKLNSTDGKDHFTNTSAMLIGGGVIGDRVIGAYDERLIGRNVDLSSGDVSDSGTLMTASTVGSTLLAAGDLDPAEFGESEPLQGIFA